MTKPINISPLVMTVPPALAAVLRIAAERAEVAPDELVLDILRDAFAAISHKDRVA